MYKSGDREADAYSLLNGNGCCLQGLLCCPVNTAISQDGVSDPRTDLVRFAHIDNGFHHMVIPVRARQSVVEPALNFIKALLVAVADGELGTMFQKELSGSKADGTSRTSHKNDLPIEARQRRIRDHSAQRAHD